jgi:hypothetical protein
VRIGRYRSVTGFVKPTESAQVGATHRRGVHGKEIGVSADGKSTVLMQETRMSTIHSPWTTTSTPAARCRTVGTALPGAQNTAHNCGNNNYDKEDRKSDYQPFRSFLLWWRVWIWVIVSWGGQCSASGMASCGASQEPLDVRITYHYC